MNSKDDLDIMRNVRELLEIMERKRKIREAYEQTPEFLVNYKPIQSQWNSTTFHLVQEKSFDDEFVKKMKKFDFHEKHDLNEGYSPTVRKVRTKGTVYDGEIRSYVTTLLIFYDDTTNTATHYVGYEERFTEADIAELKRFCPCHMCKLPWWSLSKYLGCPGCPGCLKYVEAQTPNPNDPSFLDNLKKAAKKMREVENAKIKYS